MRRRRHALMVMMCLAFVVATARSRAALGQLTPGATTTAPGSGVGYFIAEGTGRAGYRASDRQLALWALQAWQRTAGPGLRFEPASEANALIRVYWVEPNSGTYGEMRPVMVGGRHGAAVFIQPDVQSLGPEIARRVQDDALLRDSIVYLTCLHELGHALGLDHTRSFSDIMYYFGYGGDVVAYFNRYRSQLRTRNDISGVSGLSDADASRIRAIYADK